MKIKKIETYGDLPEYGKYVLVSGIDKGMYNIRRWHVCEMNDLEDGLDYRDKGKFFWLTEKGTKIEEVTHWCDTPCMINETVENYAQSLVKYGLYPTISKARKESNRWYKKHINGFEEPLLCPIETHQ